jgi:hypothetical protein
MATISALRRAHAREAHATSLPAAAAISPVMVAVL